jgi:hypothetical protein
MSPARVAHRPKKSRKRWWVLIILLLLLAVCCGRCAEPPGPAPAPAPAPAVAVTAAAPAPPPTPAPARVVPKPRPAFTPPPSEPLPWLAALRMQVGARGPALAPCFSGVARPGALRWTALVDPATGRAAEMTVEPSLQSEELSGEQRACVLRVLSQPAYTLPNADPRSTPSRVALIVEF